MPDRARRLLALWLKTRDYITTQSQRPLLQSSRFLPPLAPSQVPKSLPFQNGRPVLRTNYLQFQVNCQLYSNRSATLSFLLEPECNFVILLKPECNCVIFPRTGVHFCQLYSNRSAILSFLLEPEGNFVICTKTGVRSSQRIKPVVITGWFKHQTPISFRVQCPRRL